MRAKLLIFIQLFLLAISSFAAPSYDAFLQALYQPIQTPILPPKNTFVFVLHSAAFHHVLKDQCLPGEYIDAVLEDFKRLVELGSQAKNINIILLLSDFDGSNLKAFSDGHLIVDRAQKEKLHLADPQTLGQLLQFAKLQFPNTDVYLTYRSHGFFPNVEQGFDENFPEEAYGIDTFASSLAMGGPVKTVFFAACEMAWAEVLYAVAPFTESVVASQVRVLESGVVGFDYSFLRDISNETTSQKINEMIAIDALSSFSEGPFLREKTKEQPVTLVELQGFSDLYKSFIDWIKQIESLNVDVKLHIAESIVKKEISQIFANDMKAHGKTREQILQRGEHLANIPNAEQYDMIMAISALVTIPDLSEALQKQGINLWLELYRRITLFHESPYSLKYGLSFHYPLLH